EASARVHWRSPHPSLPLACDPRTEQGSLGFTLSFAPGWAGPSRARQGGDKPQALARNHVTSITGLLRRAHSTRAASRRNSREKCLRLGADRIFGKTYPP